MTSTLRFLAVSCIALIALLSAAPARAAVVNLDVGDGTPNRYVGQGALADPGNDYWNDSTDTGPLLESDGVTASTITVSLTGSGFEPGAGSGISNALLRDYQFATTFFGDYIRNITIGGLTVSTSYLIYVYSTGDQEGQAALIELNGVQAATSGVPSEQFLEGENYVVMEVVSDASGVIAGTWRAFASASSGAINGFQITPGSLPTRVREIAGAERLVVHSPGDAIEVEVSFSDPVTLSQVGGSKLQLDIEGALVDATHAGATSGTALRFVATAPAATSFDVKVTPNSLQLLGGATLVDGDALAVQLGHGEIALANDQISTQGLSVYPAPPALPVGEMVAPSPHYEIRVRETGGSWQTAFPWLTKCVDDVPGVPASDGYYSDQIGGWSHTYANFEMAENFEVEIEITHLDPADPTRQTQIDIQKATPHPRRNVKSWRIENGRAYVVIDRPALLSVDIDGQFDDNPAPASGFVNENALHAVSVFANPFLLDKPDVNDPDVLSVAPGTIPPEDGAWTTLYFLPGVHELFSPPWTDGDDFGLRSGKRYYIPGDAIVHASLTNQQNDPGGGQDLRIFGHGTISGERIPHTDVLGIVNPDNTYHTNKPIYVSGNPKGSRYEGVTVADSANHSIFLGGGFNVDPADENIIRWVKAITWRANGDGVSPNGSAYLEDSFLRTQDDGVYIGGYGIRRMVLWSDVNGMPLRNSNMLLDNPAPYRRLGKLFVEDIDILYARTRFGSGPGRSAIGFPDPASSVAFFPSNDNDGSHVVFRNITLHDLFPTRTLFGWDLGSGTTPLAERLPVSGVRFENVRAAARNVDGELDPFIGIPEASITGLIFQDVTLAGEHYDAIGDFSVTGDVSGFVFQRTAPETMTFQNASGVGKWYLPEDWDSGVEPADNDTASHTSNGDTLIVDAPAYAGTLNVGHPSTAVVAIENDGHLTIVDQISLGAGGPGEIQVLDGRLTLRSSLGSALAISNGALRVEGGTFLWLGDHVTDIQTLFAAGSITFANGQSVPPRANGTLIGQSGPDELYAAFDAGEGDTLVWVLSTNPVPTLHPFALAMLAASMLAFGAYRVRSQATA